MIPTDTTKMESELGPQLDKLTPEERELAGKYVLRSKMGGLFGDKAPDTHVTLGQAIEAQRKFEADEKGKEQASTDRQAKIEANLKAHETPLTQILTALCSVKTFDEAGAGSPDSKISLTLMVSNKDKSERKIKSMKGKLIFFDEKGEEMKPWPVETDNEDALNNLGGFVTVESKYDPSSPADKYLKDIEVYELKFRFSPEEIVFEDGTKMTSTAS